MIWFKNKSRYTDTGLFKTINQVIEVTCQQNFKIDSIFKIYFDQKSR